LIVIAGVRNERFPHHFCYGVWVPAFAGTTIFGLQLRAQQIAGETLKRGISRPGT
jgi:hypothetical protein